MVAVAGDGCRKGISVQSLSLKHLFYQRIELCTYSRELQ